MTIIDNVKLQSIIIIKPGKLAYSHSCIADFVLLLCLELAGQDPVKLDLGFNQLHVASTPSATFPLDITGKTFLWKRNDEWLADNPRVKIGVVGTNELHSVTRVVLNSSMLSVKLGIKTMLNEDFLKEPVRKSNYDLELGPSRKNSHLTCEFVGQVWD